jgi:hypothetical protein
MSLLSNNDRMNTQNERSSRSSVKQLNWRHQVVANPAAQLSQYDCLEKLWIGPNVDPSIVYALPTDSLVTLDWDMTDDAGSSNGGGVLVNDGALEALLQHPSLRSLCLRFRGDSVVLSLAKYLHLSPRQRLESLDLRGNQISDVGATALAEALLRSSNDDDQHDDEEVSSSPSSSPSPSSVVVVVVVVAAFSSSGIQSSRGSRYPCIVSGPERSKVSTGKSGPKLQWN